MALAYLEACGLSTASSWSSTRWATRSCRPAYVETLRAALRAQRCAALRRLPAPHGDEPAARARLQGARRTRPIIEALPRIADHLCAECRDHFAEVRRELDLLGIPYRLEPPAGARPRLLHAHDVRGRRAARWARRTACSAAAATTAWSRTWAGPTSRGIGFALGHGAAGDAAAARRGRARAATCSWRRWPTGALDRALAAAARAAARPACAC